MPLNIVQLESRRDRLHKEIINNLNFLAGSVTSQGPRGGFSLTTAQNGKTRTKYIRNTLVDEVRQMTKRHAKLKELLKDLSEINWELLKAKSEI